MKKSENNNSFSLHINGSRCIFPIKVLIEKINFWALELAAKIA
jgi:hypothetical protein